MLQFFILIFLSGLTVSVCDMFNFPHVSGPPNFIYRKFYDCADKPTPINFTATPRWLNSTFQVIDADINTPIPIGNNLMVKVVTYTQVQDKWVHLVNLTDKVCQVLRLYVGPLRKDILASVGLAPDTCPIPKGIYHGRNVHFDMRESRVPTFPYGKFKLLLSLHDVDTDALKLCLGLLFENKQF